MRGTLERMTKMTTITYVIIAVLVIIAIASLVKVHLLQKNNYKPDNGEICDEKITVALEDSVFDSHDSKTPIGVVDDYIDCSFEEASLTVALPYVAIAKSGRFLVKVCDKNVTTNLWVKPTNIHKEYFLKTEETEEIDGFENISSSK